MPEIGVLTFDRPPGFEHLTHGEWIHLLRERVAAVEAGAAEERRHTGQRVLGDKAVLAQDWNDSPSSRKPRRELSPRVAARSRWSRIDALARDRAFLRAYRAARDAFVHGLNCLFPVGTYWLRRFAAVACLKAAEADQMQPGAAPAQA